MARPPSSGAATASTGPLTAAERALSEGLRHAQSQVREAKSEDGGSAGFNALAITAIRAGSQVEVRIEAYGPNGASTGEHQVDVSQSDLAQAVLADMARRGATRAVYWADPSWDGMVGFRIFERGQPQPQGGRLSRLRERLRRALGRGHAGGDGGPGGKPEVDPFAEDPLPAAEPAARAQPTAAERELAEIDAMLEAITAEAGHQVIGNNRFRESQPWLDKNFVATASRPPRLTETAGPKASHLRTVHIATIRTLRTDGPEVRGMAALVNEAAAEAKAARQAALAAEGLAANVRRLLKRYELTGQRNPETAPEMEALEEIIKRRQARYEHSRTDFERALKVVTAGRQIVADLRAEDRAQRAQARVDLTAREPRAIKAVLGQIARDCSRGDRHGPTAAVNASIAARLSKRVLEVYPADLTRSPEVAAQRTALETISQGGEPRQLADIASAALQPGMGLA